MKLSTSEKKLLSIIINGEAIPKDKKGRYSLYMHKAVSKLLVKGLIVLDDDNQVQLVDPEKIKSILNS
jgi:hypothetical protein